MICTKTTTLVTNDLYKNNIVVAVGVDDDLCLCAYQPL
jgi:hypothetical protein